MANDIIGVKEVKKLFEDVGKAPAKVMTASTKKGARIVLSYAKAHVPESVDGSHGHPPGTLKRSLRIKKEKHKKGKSVYTVGPDETGWYAHFVDYGFTDRKGIKWQGNWFLRNAIDSNRGVIQDTILKDMAKELDKLR
ncbi:HK97-gp10 family putative phage morphogenesis protein [Desulfosporosinus fructosivorans]